MRACCRLTTPNLRGILLLLKIFGGLHLGPPLFWQNIFIVPQFTPKINSKPLPVSPIRICVNTRMAYKCLIDLYFVCRLPPLNLSL